ncbi:MAG: hypothetical protein AAF690_03125 [Acidobacteriota bacterium]
MRSAFPSRLSRLAVVTLLAGAASAQSPSTRIEQPIGVQHKAGRGLTDSRVDAVAASGDGSIYANVGETLFRLEPPSRTGDLREQIAGLGEARWQPVALPDQSSLAPGLLGSLQRGVVWVEPDRTTARTLVGNEPLKLENGAVWSIANTADFGATYLASETSLTKFGDDAQAWDIEDLLRGARKATERYDAPWTVALDLQREIVAVGLRGTDSRGLRLRELSGSSRDLELLVPRNSAREWVPRDVRDVHFDAAGRLWFVIGQTVGVYLPQDRSFRLWDEHDGLPWSEVDCITSQPGKDAGADGASIWLGTRQGLIHLEANLVAPELSQWSYKQGPRWLPHDHVHSLTFDARGDLWAATEGGVAQIAFLETTLQEKAEYFDEVIDAQHKRTEYGYVDALHLPSVDADLASGTLHSSDNDGLWTSMYGAAQAFAWASTGSEEARRRAREAFRAVAFLSEVTRGGTPAMQPGFPARSILPTSGPNPNDGQAERDAETQRRDRKWKSLMPRWGTSADGRWYWKADTSSDELDGHYFFYGVYYDLVADQDEKAEVREVVHRITDHLLRNDYSLVDHDGEHTRWAVFGPQALNHDPSWWEERGLNSMSVLSYLRVAEHVSATPEEAERYAANARDLIDNHGYAASARHPKVQQGPGTGNQSDDEMALMNLYNLLRYESDPTLRAQWAHTMERYSTLVGPERNPLFHFLFAGALEGEEIRYADAYDDYVVRADRDTLSADALETLLRYPLDRRDWPLANSHRHDVELLRSSSTGRPRGHRADGRVLPIDERFVGHWNHDPWSLDFGGRGTRIADGASYLLPYYLGRFYGFIE